MSYAKWKNQNQSIATATVTTVATLEQKTGFKDDTKLLTVAKAASVAVAAGENQKKSEPTTKIKPPPQIPIFGGGYSVILANSTNRQTVKLNHPKVEAQQHTANDSPPYSTDELLTYYEKPLFHHLLNCPYCHIERAEYCVNGYANGSVYDALLLNREDAQAMRTSLALRVDKALISGDRRYIPSSIKNGDKL